MLENMDIKAPCKGCQALDRKDNMHKDRYTGEYYHEACKWEFRSGYELAKERYRKIYGVPMAV